MSEFDFIKTHLAPLAGRAGLGLTDDAAIWQPPSGYELVITQDTMVEGVHFPNGHYGADTAEKLLRVNLSDLAAKGATPHGYMLSLSLPRGLDEKWLAAFALGLKQGQEEFELSLFGGDTTVTDRPEAPMVVSATLFGLVPKGQAVLRRGARVGDALFVTGPIGDASLGVKIVLGEALSPAPSGEAIWAWEQAYYRPQPRIEFRKTLRKYASAALDISDGLIADARHLARASDVGLSINIDAVPLSAATASWLAKQPQKAERDSVMKSLITGGDDYEILFTARASDKAALIKEAKAVGMTLTQIGEVTERAEQEQEQEQEHAQDKDQGVTATDATGKVWSFETAGWTHF